MSQAFKLSTINWLFGKIIRTLTVFDVFSLYFNSKHFYFSRLTHPLSLRYTYTIYASTIHSHELLLLLYCCCAHRIYVPQTQWMLQFIQVEILCVNIQNEYRYIKNGHCLRTEWQVFLSATTTNCMSNWKCLQMHTNMCKAFRIFQFIVIIWIFLHEWITIDFCFSFSIDENYNIFAPYTIFTEIYDKIEKNKIKIPWASHKQNRKCSNEEHLHKNKN